jgi:signal transduction histidine kinase
MEPYFHQTWSFAVLCLAGLGLAVVGAHRLRVRQLRFRFGLILQERARLTHDLHDTLLQGLAGVVYQLEAVRLQFDSAPQTSKQKLERSIEQADRALKEARQTVSSIAWPAVENGLLGDALRECGRQITLDSGAAFEIELNGEVRESSPEVEASLFALAREAITNAAKHARAGKIRLELNYSKRGLELVVEDDGSGFDVPSAKGKRDHWGLLGLETRANQIGATLKITTAPGCGTRIEAHLPWRRWPRFGRSRAAKVSSLPY